MAFLSSFFIEQTANLIMINFLEAINFFTFLDQVLINNLFREIHFEKN